MNIPPSTGQRATHEVFNQSAPLEGYNLYTGNRALVDAVAFNGGGAHAGFLAEVRAFADTMRRVFAERASLQSAAADRAVV